MGSFRDSGVAFGAGGCGRWGRPPPSGGGRLRLRPSVGSVVGRSAAVLHRPCARPREGVAAGRPPSRVPTPPGRREGGGCGSAMGGVNANPSLALGETGSALYSEGAATV